mgnify:CR=1 FL=1
MGPEDEGAYLLVELDRVPHQAQGRPAPKGHLALALLSGKRPEAPAPVQQAPIVEDDREHLDAKAHGDVVVGAQFQGPRPSTQPLLYHHRRGSSLRALDRVVSEPDERGWNATEIASAAIDRSADRTEGIAAFLEKRSPDWAG